MKTFVLRIQKPTTARQNPANPANPANHVRTIVVVAESTDAALAITHLNYPDALWVQCEQEILPGQVFVARA